MQRNNRQRGHSAPTPVRQQQENQRGGGERGAGGSTAGAENRELIAPLPVAVRGRAARAEHPGLWLDKYAETWKRGWYSRGEEARLSETVQKPALQKVVGLTEGARQKWSGEFGAAAERRRAMLEALGARSFAATTTGPLTLHLARAAALENAGLALHPLYGFAYLPASGLKGMARAYAEAVWLPSLQKEKQPAEWHRIEEVFGWAPTPERRERLRKHPEHRRFRGNDPDGAEITASAGQVIFHDAWPEQWPELLVDIVNNHHPDYYQANEEKVPYQANEEKVPPPGDWENPRPVYFLAVQPGTRFRFALAPARRDTDVALLKQAEEWLLGALTHEGAGAKTAAGYGRFRADTPEIQSRTPELPTKTRPVFKATRAVFDTKLELVTPAFLAGAEQKREDCDLRPATLRGVLRWWWRTLHAGFLTPEELRALETAIWGSAEVGGAVRIVVEPLQRPDPQLYDKQGIRRAKNLRSGGKGIPGLSYISFGMDDDKKLPDGRKQRIQRFYLEPAHRWRVRLTARDPEPERKGSEEDSSNRVDRVLEQAKAALWLLCHFGGVGAKARKGFGSLATPPELDSWTLGRCEEAARELRTGAASLTSSPESPSLQKMLREEVVIGAASAWHALDIVGTAYQKAVKSIEPKYNRRALGLPRNQELSREEEAAFRTGGRVSDRYASPLHLHLEPGSGGWTIRAVAFPSPELPEDPTQQASAKLLREALSTLREQLRPSLRQSAAQHNKPHSRQRTQQTAFPSRPAPAGVSTKDIVEAVLLEEKTKKDGWRARHDPTGRTGHIVNSQLLGPEAKPGDTVRLRVDSVPADGKTLIFSVPAGENAAAQKSRR